MMQVTVPQVDAWLARGEHENLEFKEAKEQYDFTKLCRYCIALANEGGGTLLLGVADSPPHVVGSRAVNDPAGMQNKLLERLRFRVDIGEVAHPGGRVVVLSIPSRPRGTAYSLEGAYLMRSGEELVPMTEDQLRRIFSEERPRWLDTVAADGLSATEVIGLLDTDTFADLLQTPRRADTEDAVAALVRSRLVDRDGSKYSIRRVGALLLARRLSDFEGVGRRAARVIVYRGTSKLETISDQQSGNGIAVGFQKLVHYVGERIPHNEVIEDALRKSTQLVPAIVIRELAANVLVHQDFDESGSSPLIEVYEDRVEFSNPGEPVVPADRFIDGAQSRNEALTDLLRQMRICEEKGSGIDKVVNAAEFFQLPAPDFRVGLRRTSVVVFGPRPFDAMLRDERVRACYQHCCLRWVMNDRMTNQSLRQRFRLPEKKSTVVSQIISATVDEGLIKPDEAVGSSRKYARYLPRWA